MFGDIFKNKKTEEYYVFIRQVNEDSAVFIMIDDRYSYTIPFNDMELWLSNADKANY